MLRLDDIVYVIVWIVVLAITCLFAATALFGTWKIFQSIRWDDGGSIVISLIWFFFSIVIALLIGWLLLWVIREKVLTEIGKESKMKSEADSRQR